MAVGARDQTTRGEYDLAHHGPDDLIGAIGYVRLV